MRLDDMVDPAAPLAKYSLDRLVLYPNGFSNDDPNPSR
jgi:hypothetical protein